MSLNCSTISTTWTPRGQQHRPMGNAATSRLHFPSSPALQCGTTHTTTHTLVGLPAGPLGNRWDPFISSLKEVAMTFADEIDRDPTAIFWG
jgi:hypothetical protein